MTTNIMLAHNGSRGFPSIRMPAWDITCLKQVTFMCCGGSPPSFGQLRDVFQGNAVLLDELLSRIFRFGPIGS